MKRIITFLFAVLMMVGMANAQTVVRNGVFSNMYMGISAGAQHNPVSNYDYFEFNTLNYNAALELGKSVTPITGFSLKGTAYPTFEDGFNVNAMNVSGNTKFDLMNLFGGYKGYPRRVEIQTVTGIGWDHTFATETPEEPERDGEYNPNDMSLNAGLEFDFNLGKNRAWYITFTPQVVAHNIIRNYQDIEPMVKGANVQANLGITYRFNNRKVDSHNFVICDKVYTEQQYADLYALYDECMNRPAQVDTVVVEKTVETVVETPTMLSNAVIVFPKGSSELGEAEIHRLDIIMEALDKEGTYVVCGSADTGTGTPEINERLSTERANVVKELLEKNGFKNVETTTKLDAFTDAEISRCAIIRIK